MKDEEEVRIAKSDYDFRLHMVKFSGRTDEAIRRLSKSDSDQWKEINALKRAPYRMAVIASTIATAVSASVIGIIEALKRS